MVTAVRQRKNKMVKESMYEGKSSAFVTAYPDKRAGQRHHPRNKNYDCALILITAFAVLTVGHAEEQ